VVQVNNYSVKVEQDLRLVVKKASLQVQLQLLAVAKPALD
jgi:hypothetical protein